MKTPVLESTFNKFIDLKACDFVKKTPAPASSCETVKNTFFYKILLVAASGKGR